MWNHESEHMCLPVEEFSREEETGQAARDQDADGDRVKLADESPISHGGSRALFAPIRDFYSMRPKARLSAYENGMRSELLSRWKRERLGQAASTGDPERADIRHANRLEAWRYPTACFRQGERVSEISGLTASGYRKALIANKGSLGRREEKTFHFTSAFESPLLKRIRTEYAHFDPHGRRRLEKSEGGKFYRVSHSRWYGGGSS